MGRGYRGRGGRSRGGQSRGPQTCYRCGEAGHRASDCTLPAPVMKCHRCGEEGHHVRDCPVQGGALTSHSEEDCGMSQYVNASWKGFSGIIKQNFSDFLVNEIDMSGKVVNLLSTEPPNMAEIQKEHAQAESGAPVATESGPTPREESGSNANAAPKPSAESVFTELIGPEAAGKFILFVSPVASDTKVEDGAAAEESSKQTEFVFPASDDKVLRTRMHRAVKEYFGGRADTDTVDVEGLKSVRVTLRGHGKRSRDDGEGTSNRPDRRNGQLQWPATLGKYLTFTLCKENQDTINAISNIAKTIRIKPNVFQYAGTKDRRGVTSQRVSAFKMDPARLAGMSAKSDRMKIGDYTFEDKPLRLGALNGNEFTITLRNVIGATQVEIEDGLKSVRDRGFLNYYGLQRFGSGAVMTSTPGQHILRQEWEAACRSILKPRDDDRPDFRSALQEFLAGTGSAKDALQTLPGKMSNERAMLQHYIDRGNNDHLGALMRLPRTMLMMYAHSYQSLIFNLTASERIARFGAEKAVAGDLVLKSTGSSNRPLNLLGDAVAAEGDGVGVDPGADPDEDVDLHALPTVEVLTEETASQYSIEDVVIPLPGTDTVAPGGEMGEFYRKAMEKHGISQSNFRSAHNVFFLRGGYRSLICKPGSMDWEFIRYNSPEAQLTLSRLDELRGVQLGVQEDGDFLGLRIRFRLPPSTYATMLLREAIRQSTATSDQRALTLAASNAGEAPAGSSTEKAAAASDQ